MSIIAAPGSLREEDLKFQGSLGYMEKPSQGKKKKSLKQNKQTKKPHCLKQNIYRYAAVICMFFFDRR